MGVELFQRNAAAGKSSGYEDKSLFHPSVRSTSPVTAGVPKVTCAEKAPTDAASAAHSGFGSVSKVPGLPVCLKVDSCLLDPPGSTPSAGR